jgi:hypothetical protein
MKLAISILAFIVGLALGVTLLPAWPQVRPSISDGALEYLAQRGRRIDVIVIGSSTVRVHFVTALFNEEMKKRGHDVQAFAFARSGLQGAELDYYLERILALDLPELKWVLVDVSLNQFRPLEPDNWYKGRVVQWHAPEQVLTLQRLIFAKNASLASKLEQLWPHVEHALLRAANVGDGVESAKKGTLLRQRKPERLLPASSFSVGEYVQNAQKKRLASYAKHHGKKFAKAVATLRKARAVPESKLGKHLRPNEYAVIFRDRIERHGAKAAFILSPMLSDIRMHRDVPGAADLRILDFNDPARYPELYALEHRYDPVHLAWSGAQLFTVRLAEQLTAMLEAEGDNRMRSAEH